MIDPRRRRSFELRWSAVSLVGIAVVAFAAPAAAESSLNERRRSEAAAVLATHPSEAAAVAAVATLVDVATDVGTARVAPLFEAFVRNRASHPLVAAQASHHLALWEAAGGDAAAAQARLRGLGLIEEFAVCGPFDASGRAGIDHVHPPEQRNGGPAPGRTFAGKERDVAWRTVRDVGIAGAFALDGVLRPDKDAAAYLLVSVHSDRARPAVLRLGSAGPVKVWVDGKLVGRKDVVREARLDQEAMTFTLAAGETPILIKTVVLGGAWRVYARLTDHAGRALAGVRVRAAARASSLVAPDARGKSGAPVAVIGSGSDLGSILRRRVQAVPKRLAAQAAVAWLDLGRWLEVSRQSDRESKDDEAVLDNAVAAGLAAGDDASVTVATDALLLLGQRALEPDARRQALERAIELSRDPARRAVALAGLGDLARDQRRERSAIARFRESIAADADNVDAALALASEAEGVGMPASALAGLDALKAPARDSDRVQLARARLLDALGRRREAEAVRRALFGHRRTDLELALSLARAARDRGDLAAAIDLHEQAARLRPDLTFVATEASRMREGRGDVAGARAGLEALTSRLSDDTTVWEELGRMLIRTGDLPAGSAALRRALALRPQNPALRRYAARIEGQLRGDDTDAVDELVRTYAEDGAALARPELRAAAPGAGAAAGIDVLLEKSVVRVHRNGLSERFVQRVMAIRTERGAREALEQGIRYTPGSQEVEVRRARIYRANAAVGKTAADVDLDVIEVGGRDDRDLSEPWAGLYYDVRAEVVLYEGLRPGDVIELAYTIADVSFENVLRDYFGDIELIGEAAPRRRWEYVLLSPAERTLHINQPALPGLTKTESREGDERITRFVARDVPPARAEPGMPGWTEVLPYLHISTFASWQDVGRWYWGLIEDQLAADEPLRRAGRAAVDAAKASSVLEKVRALHRLVIESTRYVGLEFGIHGYKPYKVTQVMTRRFGDCKDKASLLHVLLREAGIDSDIVLLRTKRSGRVAPFPASLAIFDHAIVYVPALDLYLDGTAEYSGLRELPSEDQGVMVLRVSRNRTVITETPVLPASDNWVLRRWTATLDESGGARIDEQISVSGQAAPEWREHYETPGERQERFARVWEGRFPGATLVSVTVDGVDDRNRPVLARSVADVPGLAEDSGGGLWRVPVAAREADYLRSYGRLSARTHAYLLAYPFAHDEQLSFALPKGWTVVDLPAPARIESPFGSVSLAVEPLPDGQGVRVVSHVEITKNQIAPKDYGAFRAFLGQIDQVLRRSIVVRAKGAS